MLPSYSIYIFLFLIFTGCSTHKTSIKKVSSQDSIQAPSQVLAPIENEVQDSKTLSLLEKTTEDIVIDHKFFKVNYNLSNRLAKYVTYKIRASNLRKKSFKRKDAFRSDPYLKSQNIPFATPAEYANTGYDKGHLAPAGDFSWSKEASDTTFVMSNMVPQLPKLNRDSWKRLEIKERRWACGEGELTVITGPILSPGYHTLPKGLPIPQQFFKVIIDETPPKKIISFIFNQEDIGDVINSRIADVKTIKTKTQLSFKNFNFPETENRLPANLNAWKEADCGED